MEGWRIYAGEMVTAQICSRGILNTSLLEAMKNIPRHMFVPPEYQRLSYSDCAVPIGLDQTISQPYMVAKMTDLLVPSPQEGTKILEIGTGSGYQAAVLSEMGMVVNSIERIEELGKRAQNVLRELGYSVKVLVSDGRKGYEPDSPYDGIIVTAASDRIEDAWMNQLANGGRIVIPLRVKPGLEQLLVRIKRGSQFKDTWYDYCQFVPLLKGVIVEDNPLL